MQSIVNSWVTAGREIDHSKYNGSLTDFVSDISEEVCSQLHSGIMKATRKIVLDEIISNIIVEYVTAKKSERPLKHEESSQIVKTMDFAPSKEVPENQELEGCCGGEGVASLTVHHKDEESRQTVKTCLRDGIMVIFFIHFVLVLHDMLGSKFYLNNMIQTRKWGTTLRVREQHLSVFTHKHPLQIMMSLLDARTLEF